MDKKVEIFLDKGDINEAKRVLLSSDKYFYLEGDMTFDSNFKAYQNLRWFNRNLSKICTQISILEGKKNALEFMEAHFKPYGNSSDGKKQVNDEEKGEIIRSINNSDK